MIFFAFDLDSTITKEEMFPRMAEKMGLGPAMRSLTDDALAGNLPLDVSLRQRIELMERIPVATAHRVLASIPLDRDIERFILSHRKQCAVVTANLDIWVAPLLERLACRGFTSRAVWEGDRVRLVSVVDKGQAARQLRSEAGILAATGDSAGDVPMLEVADYGFAHAGVHQPPASLVALATAVTPDGATLCRYLEELWLADQEGRLAPKL